MPDKLREDVYKRAAVLNLSVNELLIRQISGQLDNNVLCFDLVYIKKGERFSFKTWTKRKKEPVYRFVKFAENGNFVCQLKGHTFELDRQTYQDAKIILYHDN